MPPATQAKLLRVLQERDVPHARRAARAVGRHARRRGDQRDLPDAVRQGSFREDLFYRLNVVALRLPPLRERKDDIPLLVEAFVREFSHAECAVGCGRRPTARCTLLERYHWPGNVRELRNVIERATIVAHGDMIESAICPPSRRRLPRRRPRRRQRPAAGITVDEAERRLIEITLTHTGGNKTRAAEMLGISLKTLHNKLNRMKGEASIRVVSAPCLSASRPSRSLPSR